MAGKQRRAVFSAPGRQRVFPRLLRDLPPMTPVLRVPTSPQHHHAGAQLLPLMGMLHPSFCPGWPGLKKTKAKTPKLQQAGQTDSALVLSSERRGGRQRPRAGQRTAPEDATQQWRGGDQPQGWPAAAEGEGESLQVCS